LFALPRTQHIVDVITSSVTQHGQVLKFEGEGMPKHDYPSDRGVLEITIKVTMPQRLTDAQQSEIRALLA
jgi:DnaJ-class molecular chaperone